MALKSPNLETLHIVFVPMLAPGHFIPMIDTAKLIASRGVKVTFFVTPVIAARYKSCESKSIPIHFIQVPFASQEVGLQEGYETADNISPWEWPKFSSALNMWQTSVEHFIEHMESLPTCMISDRFIPQVAGIAERLGLRRIIFDGMGCLSLVVIHQIEVSKIHETVAESEPFTVAGLPDEIVITRKQIPNFVYPDSPEMAEYRDKIREADRHVYGILINSFDELEPDYIQKLRKIHKNRAWCIGPVSLRNKERSEKATRGNKATIEETQCLEWLDKQEPGSVIYACLGSISQLIQQPVLVELGRALEASRRAFVWVLKTSELMGDMEKWLSENEFEEKTRGRGLLIRGWAPQVLILSHKAVGGFLTHCGWNSIMEGISSGVPMITWPLFGEQFFNEKLVSQILRIGVSVESKKAALTEENKENDKFLEAFEDVMCGDDKAMEIRRRAKEWSEMAKKATEEGGSSCHNILRFLEDMALPQDAP